MDAATAVGEIRSAHGHWVYWVYWALGTVHWAGVSTTFLQAIYYLGQKFLEY